MLQLVETLGVRMFEVPARLLPQAAALACGRGLGRLAWRLGVRRAVCESNLQRAMSATTTAAERRHIAVGAYENLGMLVLEFFRLLHLSEARRRGLLHIDGIEHFRAALASGRGAIAITGHVGNWELLGACTAAQGLPITVVAQRLRNRRLDAYVTRARESLGMRVLERGMGLRGVQEHLQANRLVGFLSDQDARRRGVFVPFFGSLASTPKGAAQLALRQRVPLIPFFGTRLADGRHRMRVHAPLQPRYDVPEEEAVHDLMTRFNELLEAAIRSAPAQYLWLHRRWKTAPAAVSSPVSPSR